jgi:two-component system cell cycle sensor histidine kinase/response regulator CckA
MTSDALELAQAELARLRKSEAYYRVLAEAAQDHIFVIDKDDRVQYVNQAGARQFQTTPDKVIGRRRSEIFPPEIAARQGANLREVLSTGRPIYVEGRTFYREREVWLGTWLAPILDEEGNVTAVLGLSRDITERRQLQSELANAQKMEAIGRLAGGVAHDFNNHLTAIIGYVDMILGQIGDDKPISNDLKEVQRAAERSADLVKRLLAFGRRQLLQPRDLSVNTVINGLTPMLTRLIGEGTQIVVTLACDLHSVVADASQIEQIIMNLSLNARDAMPSGGTLSIETANAAPNVLLTVRDTGTGMSATTKEHLFEPFFTTKPVGQGTGLGLSTVYGIVKELGGTIQIDSEEGHGSAFRILMPAAAHEPEVAAPTSRARTGSPIVSHATILLVEDEDTVRRFAKIVLQRHGFRVIEADSGERALALVSGSQEPIALLLTDVVMPQLSGPELAEQLKKLRPEMPVLFMSGYPAGMIMDGQPLDASVRLLPKPFTTAELLASIEEVLGKG